VAPAELEDVLQSHKDVLEAAVTATWDDNQRTEIPIGYVVLQPEVQEAERQRVLNDIQKYVDTRVSSYKRLRGGLHAIEKLPKNATGKTLRKSLPVHVEAARRAAAKSPKPNL
jgi:acyl-coenzyme A synthetase/AMP-(fatty) acid ligase